MKEYTYDEIEIGLTEQFQTEVTKEKMKWFQLITGDVNPLHCDSDFAKEKGYPDCVAYGMLTSSFYSTLAGVYLPGKNSLIHSVETKLLKPVYAGDQLLISGKVVEKEDLFHLLKIRAEIFNQKGERVSKAIMKVGVLI